MNSIKVAWSQPKRAESIQILVSHHNKALDSAKTRFVVKVPVHARSTTITIPSSWRAKIGDGSGNPVFVRVLLKNAGKSKNEDRMELHASTNTIWNLRPKIAFRHL